MPYLTPDPPASDKLVLVSVPDTFISRFWGALLELLSLYRWEEYGTVTRQEAIDYCSQILDEVQADMRVMTVPPGGVVGQILRLADVATGTLEWVDYTPGTPEPSGTEILNNGNLETGTGNAFADWNLSFPEGSTVEETATAHDGTRAVKLSCNSNGVNPSISQGFDLTPGGKYQISAWARGNGVTCKGALYLLEAGGEYRTLVEINTAGATSDYGEVKAVFYVPDDLASPNRGSLILTFYAPLNGDIVYFDDISLLQL